MNPAGAATLVAGILLTAVANAARAALPEMVTSRGRDPSERRREAALRLRVIWLGGVAGLLLTGAGIVLSVTLLPIPPLFSAAALASAALVLCEFIPPLWVQRLPEGVAPRLLAFPMFVLTAVFTIPARIILGSIDRDSDDWAYPPPDTLWLEQRREKGDQEELEKEQELVDSILDFSDKIVREVMVPRIDVDFIEFSDDISSVIAQVKKAGRSRIPVYRKVIDDIAGVLYAKDLLGIPTDTPPGEFHLESILREAYFVPEFKRIDMLFSEFQTSRIHMAVVVDEYGGTAGIVTMEDILEEVFGEIRDEYDSEQPMVRSIGKGAYRIDARLSIEELNDLLQTSLEEDEDYESVGGLVYQRLGRIPESGETVDIEGWTFTVEKVLGQRIVFLRIVPVPEEQRN